METTGAETEAGADKAEVRCPSCGRKNRVLRGRLTESPVCGVCRQPLFPGRTRAVTDATWAEQVEASPLPVLVEFWAPWCAPCRVMAPVLEQIAADERGRLQVAKLNVDENPGTAGRFDVRAIPTFLVFRGPLLIDELRGAVPKATLMNRIARIL